MNQKTAPRRKENRFFTFAKFVILTGALIGFLNTTSAQVRPLITSLTSAQRTQLCSLMQVYITPAIIKQHCDYIALTGNPSLDIHSDFDFLPFHRMYIERMEDWLILQGFPQYVPLPRWSPATCTPTEFQVVDPDCASTSCTIAP